MRLRKKINHHKVLQYSSFCREIKISPNRLTLQEIELQSYTSALNQEFENNWSLYFRPKFSVVAVSTVSSVYKPIHVAIVHSAFKIKEQTKRQVHFGGELAVGVLSLPKTGLQQSAEILSKSYNQIRESIENKLGKLKIFIRNTAAMVVNTSHNYINIIRTYISENLVLVLLILFILVVSVVTVFQTVLFFIGLVRT